MATVTTSRYGHTFECPDLPPPIKPGLAIDDPLRAKLIRQAERTAKQSRMKTERFRRQKQRKQQQEGQ